MNSDIQDSASMASLVVIVVLLIIIVLGLGIWMFMLLRHPRKSEKSIQDFRCQPVYLYGFAPGASAREITGSEGVLTLTNQGLSLEPLQLNNRNQWNLVQTNNGKIILQQHSNQTYLDFNLNSTSQLNQALEFDLVGPRRNGRVYYLRSNNQYLATAQDLSVGLMTVTGGIPLNTEWLIVLGTCQATGNAGCNS